MMNKYEQPYSAEIRAKYCKPEENVDFGERYCEICGCVLDFEEEDDIEEYGYSAYAYYRRSNTDFGGEWIYITIKENKYSSYEKGKITIYHDQEKNKWELISCTCPCGFEISDTYDTLTFKKSFNELQKRMIDLVMKGCTLTGVDTALSYLSEE